MRTYKKRRDRGTQFIRNNLELLGFGNRRDALVQAVKELFENGVINTLSIFSAFNSDVSWDSAPLELLRINVKLNETTGNIDIVCADTGSGIHAHQVKVLCCRAFETTKNSGRGSTSGKYGVGLKAAVLYSQMHASDACLKITTTSHSDGILYVQLRIDPASEETAIVKKVVHFVVNEAHQHFSDIESAADTLALYFQSLRYTAPPFIRVQFNFEVGEISTSVECQHKEEPLDRFAVDLGISADDILYATHQHESVSINCVALMLGNMEPSFHTNIEICLLRFANHTPLINGEDFFLCGITKGVSSYKVWKKYGLRCQRTNSHLVNQLVAAPLRAANGRKVERPDHPIRLVLAIDICVLGSAVNNSIKHKSLRKSTLDACYTDGVQSCCRSILNQLAEAGRLSTPQQQQDYDLVETFAPLIAQSLAAIVRQSQTDTMSLSHSPQHLDRDHCNEELILKGLHDILRN